MHKQIFINSIFITLLIVITIVSPSYASEVAPEIPAGFGPIIVSGIALSVAAIKNLKEKK